MSQPRKSVTGTHRAISTVSSRRVEQSRRGIGATAARQARLSVSQVTTRERTLPRVQRSRQDKIRRFARQFGRAMPQLPAAGESMGQFLWASAATLATVCLAYGALLAWGLVRQSSAFELSSVQAVGCVRTSCEAISLHWVDQIGKDRFDLDLEGIGKFVELDPWIARARAEVDRRGVLTLTIEERKAQLVALDQAGALWLVDRGGIPFKQVEPGDPADLPLVQGLVLMGDEVLVAKGREGLTQIRGVLDALAASSLGEGVVSSLWVDEGGAVHGTLRRGALVHLGDEAWLQRAKRLAAMVGAGIVHMTPNEDIHLEYAEQAVVCQQEDQG